jgi:hypothetical protein
MVPSIQRSFVPSWPGFATVTFVGRRQFPFNPVGDDLSRPKFRATQEVEAGALEQIFSQLSHCPAG